MTTRARTVARWASLSAGPLAFALAGFFPGPLQQLEGYGDRPALATGIFLWMAVWWLTEAVPIAVTACLPLLLYPLTGLTGRGFSADAQLASAPFVDAYIFLFLGGMMLGAGMEAWNLHRRVALHILRLVGTQPQRLLLGVLVATAAVSMWISNTATAVMMLPIAMALVAQLEVREGRRLAHFGAAVMLAVAYGANVGGVGTKIGTPTNSIFAGFLSEKLHYDLSFVRYLAVGTPVVVMFVPILWLTLWRLGKKDVIEAAGGAEVLEHELKALGPIHPREKFIAGIFVTAALLWIFSDLLRPLVAPLVPTFWPGFKFGGKHYEALVAVLAGAALLVTRTLPLRAVGRLPWGTLLLLGGSFALAAGMEGSGLSLVLGKSLSRVGSLPLPVQLIITTSATVLMSAVASNTATVNVMLNVLPRSITVLAACAMAGSFDFALPAGTPPNAIVFGSGYVRLPVMMRTGIFLDVVAALFLAVYAWLYLPLLLPV